ncbi:MAG TPA: AMP-binding protein [Mycobacteriales bacterium]|nr:AMP-binding protein [Mycobacteriales bacterium]
MTQLRRPTGETTKKTHLWSLLREQVREDTTLLLPSQDRAIPMTTLMDDAIGTAGQVVAAVGWPPRRLGLLLNNGEPWVRALLATLYLDATVVPLPLPVAFSGTDSYLEHLVRISEDAGLDAILVDPEFGKLTVAKLGGLLAGRTPLIDVHDPAPRPGPEITRGPGGPAEAVVQYTSGSTSRPKGVVLSHDAVKAGMDTISAAIDWTADDVMGLWLPLFHDMGLFSMLSAFARGSSVCLWTPAEFVRRPLKWLQSFAASPATALPAPNFFYDYLTVSAFKQGLPEGVDLSKWRKASNGAEPVQLRTLAGFEATFSRCGLIPGVVRPTYGMAEATLMVTFSPYGEAVKSLDVDRDALDLGQPVQVGTGRTRSVVSCGRAAPGMSVRIGDGDEPLESGVVGEVQILGPAVTSGYLGRPAAEQPFTADGWLRTGDLGFLVDEELYVVGRIKDMIVVRGQNFYAEDVEEIVRVTPGVDGRRSAAFAWTDSAENGADGADERMVVLWETKDEPAVAAVTSEAIRQQLSEQIGLAAVQVVTVPPATIPFTSSGKVKRTAALALCRQKNLTAPPADAVPVGGSSPEGTTR